LQEGGLGNDEAPPEALDRQLASLGGAVVVAGGNSEPAGGLGDIPSQTVIVNGIGSR